jgi:4a-hydroxytetrahydrobiopterin dehydratase
MSELAQKSCIPCNGDVPPLTTDQIWPLARELGGSWRVVDGHHLEKSYTFPDFRTALDFVYRVGLLAEAEGHHPDFELGWGRAVLRVWTHAIDGLTESDFVLAAKADKAL